MKGNDDQRGGSSSDFWPARVNDRTVNEPPQVIAAEVGGGRNPPQLHACHTGWNGNAHYQECASAEQQRPLLVELPDKGTHSVRGIRPSARRAGGRALAAVQQCTRCSEAKLAAPMSDPAREPRPCEPGAIDRQRWLRKANVGKRVPREGRVRKFAWNP